MKSPVGKRLPMEPVELEEGLDAYRCVETGGIYLPLASYWQWLSQRPGRLPHLPAGGEQPQPVQGDPEARICPETGTLMRKFKVGHGFSFSIDRSIAGIWLDGGEWDALRERGFHDELHLIFTSPWQRGIREEHRRAFRREQLTSKFGDGLLAELDGLRDKLRSHPERDYALAYLNHPDPDPERLRD